MIRRSIAVSAIAVLTLGLIPGANAAPGELDSKPPKLKPAEASVTKSLDKGPVLSLGKKSGRELYLVQLEDAAVPTYTGGVKGLAPVQAEGRDYAPEASREQAYREYVVDEQSALRKDIAGVTGRQAQVRFSYTDALNGIAVALTRAEAREVAGLTGVAAVQVDEERQLQTDVGPEWIGAPSIWDGTATPSGEGTKGEGVIAGILDSGVNAANPSFHDSVPESEGGDGYSHTNPFGSGNYVGVCDPANAAFYNPDFECNDKLIGAWDFAPGDNAEVGYAYDEDGHGTHTGSTTAGNQVDATTYAAEGTDNEFSATRNIKGVAPHANVITYDVCAGGCPLTAIVAGIEQAIDDGVDVINYSIGSAAPSNPWTDPDSLGFLNARAAGIHVATSAGNAGPGAATVGSPADVPWITSVGATQHNRQWQASVEDITADGGATYGDIQGLAFAKATDGAFPLVYGGDIGSALCIDGELEEADVAGNIIVCDRGTTGRVEKGEVVAGLGGEGMVLVNDAASGDSLNADPHALPAVHVTFDDGTALKQWMGTVTGEQASLSGGTEFIGDEVADIMAGFSSRGPNRAVEMISPSISAPGVDVLAGNGTDNEVSWGFISGTSMASPHIAGSLALLAGANPGWTPAEAQSAAMTTAVTDITDTDGSVADWFDMGSGRVDLTKAADAGLVLDVTEEDYRAADPTLGGDVKELNTASMASSQCLETCSWTRTVEATETGAGAWTAEASAVSDGIDVTVEPASFTLAAGETQEITVTADVAGSSTEDYQFGNVVLTPADGSGASPAHLPVAALPSTGRFSQESIDIDTRRDAGSQESEPIEAVEITDLDIEANGLVQATGDELAMPQDPTNTDPYDEGGTEFINVTVAEGATRFIANLTDATAPDFDLFVGKGATPSAESEVASSASGGSAESVDIPLGDGDAGQWWILVQNWEASAPTATDTVTLEHAVVGGDAGNLRAEGPETNPQGEPFTIRTFWDERAMRAGQTWYGSLTLNAAPGGTEIGTLPVTVNRFEDDVSQTVSDDTAVPGDTLTYTVEVQPNVTPEDLTYTFRERLPQGTTYVEGSGPEGATLEDGVLTWQHTMPTPVGAVGDYEWSTNATDDTCEVPFGDGGYVDLAGFGILPQPGIEGDGVTFSALDDRSYGFYEDTQSGMTFADDGFAVYGDEDNYGGTPGQAQQVPDPALPNGVAAMLWQDMQIVYDEATGAGVSIATAGPGLGIVEFDKMRLASDAEGAQGTTDFQMIAVTDSRDLIFAYDNVEGPLDGVTIGSEDQTGEHGTGLVNLGSADGAISNGTVVCGTYAQQEFLAKTFTYQATVDNDVVEGQSLFNQLTNRVDNPGSKTVGLSQFVEVTESGEVTPEPAGPKVRVIKKRDAREPKRDGVVVFKRPRSAVGERLTVNYDVRGTAKRRRDFRSLDGTVTFRPQARNAREYVRVVNSKRRLGTRKVQIVIQRGDGYRVGDPRRAVVKIREAQRRRR